jgi:hypothetical protein
MPHACEQAIRANRSLRQPHFAHSFDISLCDRTQRLVFAERF